MRDFTDVWDNYEEKLVSKMGKLMEKANNFADAQTSGMTDAILPIRKRTGTLNNSLQFKHPTKFVWTIDWTAPYADYALYRKGKVQRNLLGDNGRMLTFIRQELRGFHT